MKKNELISVQEAAAILNVSPNTIKRLLVSENITHIRIGRQIRIEQRCFEEFVKRSTCVK